MTKNSLIKAIVIFNLVFTPLVFFPFPTYFDYFYFPKYIVLMVSCLFLAIPLWINRKNLSHLLAWDLTNKMLVVFLLYLAISVFFAADPILAVNGSLTRQEGLATILLYSMLFLATRSIGQLDKKFYGVVITSAVIISVYGIVQYYGFDFVQREYFRSPNVPISTIGNQNFIGSYMVLILPLTINFWIRDKNRLSLVAYAIILFGLLTTMSRGPWIGYAISIVVYLFLDNRVSKNKFLSIRNIILFGTSLGVVLFFTLIADHSFIMRLLSIYKDINIVINSSPGASSTGSGRWFIWEKTLILIKEKPWFGIGIDNLGVIFPKRFTNETFLIFGPFTSVDKAHNEYLDQMVSSGIPSLIIYLGFLFTILNNGYKKLKVDPLKIALMSSIIGYLVQAFFNIRVVSVAFIFWIFLALLINSPQSTSQKTTEQ